MPALAELLLHYSDPEEYIWISSVICSEYPQIGFGTKIVIILNYHLSYLLTWSNDLQTMMVAVLDITKMLP